MPIHTLKDDDLSEIVKLFNENSEYDQLTPELLNEKLFEDPNFDASAVFVCYHENKLVGFMQGVMREIFAEKIGYIKLMVVHKKHRRKGIARDMYQQLETFLRSKGAVKVKIYDVPFNYWMPGIDPRYTPALCFAWRMGFEKVGDTSNLLVEVQNQDWSTAKEESELQKDKIEIRRVKNEDKEDLLDFIDNEFPLWRAEVTNSFKSTPLAVHIALLNGKIKAFSGHNGNNYGTGWFGPMGTNPDLRGKGIGGILLKRCLQNIKDWGISHSIIPWVGPIDFYSHYSNAVVDRVFWRFEKKIT